MSRHTFIAVDYGILDDDAPSVERRELLGLPPHLAQVLDAILAGGADGGGWDAENMAGQELLRRDKLADGGAALGLPGGEEDIRQRDEEDVMVDRGALGGDGALEEGGQEGV